MYQSVAMHASFAMPFAGQMIIRAGGAVKSAYAFAA
jgi:hypothetical protein